jgi:hypothetical protein
VPVAFAAKNGAADLGDAKLLKKWPLTGCGRNPAENRLGHFVHLFGHMKQAEVADPAQRLTLCLEQLPHAI